MVAEINVETLLTLVRGEDAVEWAEGKVGWKNDTNSSVCTWDGIACDPIDLSVTEIDLSMAGLGGTLPSEIGKLSNLRQLNMFRNLFTGTIPREVLALPELVSVNLGMNILSGGFPLFLSSNLESLDVDGNLLTGFIPSTIWKLYPEMIELDLSNNTFTGTLPEDLCRMTTLKKLNLAWNRLHGIIPRKLGALTRIEGLFLNDNTLYGPIPATLANPAVTLIQLFLQHNALSGSIPESISEIHTLRDFFVDGNKLTGEVPPELCDMNLNAAYYQTIPGSEYRNGCDSISCGINFKSQEGVFPCEECPEGKYTPYLGWNGVCQKDQERHIIDGLYRDTRGGEWLNAERWGNPNVPHCMYEGIDCNDDGQIVNITLTGMNLQGEIPASLGRLAHLRRLHLDDNALTGIVPSDLRFCPLEFLTISDNKLLGPLPPLLCAKEGINGNGEKGLSSCDVIACPAGSWHWNGRALKLSGHCIPCPNQPFLGQTHCGNSFSLSSMAVVGDHVSKPLVGAVIVCCSLVVVTLSVYLLRRTRIKPDDRLAKRDDLNEEGLFNANGPEQIDEEELDVLSYASKALESDQGHQPVDSQSSIMIMASAHRRNNSPEDDPVTQDLWLDVPKIA